MSSPATPTPPLPPVATASGWKRKSREALALLVLAGAAGGAFLIPWAKFSPTVALAMATYASFVWLVIVFIRGGDVFKAIENARLPFGTGFEGRAATTTTSPDGAATSSSQDIALVDLNATSNPDAVN